MKGPCKPWGRLAREIRESRIGMCALHPLSPFLSHQTFIFLFNFFSLFLTFFFFIFSTFLLNSFLSLIYFKIMCRLRKMSVMVRGGSSEFVTTGGNGPSTNAGLLRSMGKMLAKAKSAKTSLSERKMALLESIQQEFVNSSIDFTDKEDASTSEIMQTFYQAARERSAKHRDEIADLERALAKVRWHGFSPSSPSSHFFFSLSLLLFSNYCLQRLSHTIYICTLLLWFLFSPFSFDAPLRKIRKRNQDVASLEKTIAQVQHDLEMTEQRFQTEEANRIDKEEELSQVDSVFIHFSVDLLSSKPKYT